jgi:site-specific DNA recombinase
LVSGYPGSRTLRRLAEPIEILVTKAVKYRLESQVLAALLAPKAPDIAPLLERYQLLQQRSQDLVQDYASGLLNRQQLAQAKYVVESGIERVQAELAAVQPRQVFSGLEAGRAIRDAWQEEDLEWRRNLLSLLVEKIVVHPGYPGRSRWRGFVFDPEKIEAVSVAEGSAIAGAP